MYPTVLEADQDSNRTQEARSQSSGQSGSKWGAKTGSSSASRLDAESNLLWILNKLEEATQAHWTMTVSGLHPGPVSTQLGTIARNPCTFSPRISAVTSSRTDVTNERKHLDAL